MLERDFATFDEEGNMVWAPDGKPRYFKLSLILISLFSSKFTTPSVWGVQRRANFSNDMGNFGWVMHSFTVQSMRLH
jgi:hypothetical protein